MSIKDILKSLIRPETSEELNAVSDKDLKFALETITTELRRRGWQVDISEMSPDTIDIKKRVSL